MNHHNKRAAQMEPQPEQPAAVIRLLVPSSLAAKLGPVPGAKLQFEYPAHDECIVLVFPEQSPQSSGQTPEGETTEGSAAQRAAIRVLRRVVEEAEVEKGSVCCRLLVGRNGKGNLERIRMESSGAQIRVFSRDQAPAWAAPGDEVVQIAGDFSAVKKALLSVSSCLLDNPKVEAANSGATNISGVSIHGTGMPAQGDSIPPRGFVAGFSAAHDGNSHRMVMEEEVVFKLLCHFDKIGNLIGKGGSIIRTFQSETGASIKIVDAAPDSDERVVVISARENPEQKYSPAQEAVMRVYHHVAEIGFEPGAAVMARLLLHSQQIGCLLGKGGAILNELRRATGASIRIFPKEQGQRGVYQHNDVVQIIGSLQSVQDALFHITSRIRETIFPMKQPYPNFGAPPQMSSFPEMHPPSFRPRHNPASPGPYPSPVGFHHGMDHHSPFSRRDHSAQSHMERVPYSYGNERPGNGPTFERSSPRAWTSQGVSSGNHRGAGDIGSGIAPRTGSLRSESQPPYSTTVEIMIPQALISHVHGENNSNLNQIRQISGANLVVHDSKPGSLETLVVISGAPDKTHAAQSLIHAFILCGQTQG